jgi:hypothetical protein
MNYQLYFDENCQTSTNKLHEVNIVGDAVAC